MRLLLAATLAACAALLLSCIDATADSERWTGTVYPDGNDLTRHVAVGTFPSLEAYRDSCLSMLDERGWQSRGDYECGTNCRSSSFGVLVCDETRR